MKGREEKRGGRVGEERERNVLKKEMQKEGKKLNIVELYSL